MYIRIPVIAACGLFVCLTAHSQIKHDSSADAALRTLLADEWSSRLQDDPLYATQEGIRDYDERLPSVTPEDFRRRTERDKAYVQRLAGIDRAGLSPPNKINYDVFDFELHHRLALRPYQTWRIPLTSDEGFHIEVMRMAIGVIMNTPRDYENYIARLHSIPAYFAQQQANMRAGMAAGFTLPAAIMPGIVQVVDGQQYQSPDNTPFFEPFTRMPQTMEPAQRERLIAAGRAAIQTDVIPAYQRLRTFFKEEYQPSARQSVGAGDLPNGGAYYADLVKFYTNLEVSPARCTRSV